VAALSRWLHDTRVGLRTNPACVSLLAQVGIVGAGLVFFGVAAVALWLAVWHVLLSAAPFIDPLVRKHWLVGSVTPPPASLRQGGRAALWAYVALHWSYVAMYGLAAAWLWVKVGNVSLMDWVFKAAFKS
jgi:hypothetical protein